MDIKVKRLTDSAKIPTYGTDGAACFDLYADLGDLNARPQSFYQADGGNNMRVGTGLAFDIPEGFAMLIFGRSGHAFKDNIRLSNCVGVIDSDYTGEVMVKLARDDSNLIRVTDGERIAQAMIIPVERVNLLEVAYLKETARGEKGLGSTGK